MPEVFPEIKKNLQDRFTNVKDTAKGEVNVVKTSFKSLTELKPVPAVTGLVADTIDTARNFLNFQFGVFRRWIE